MTSVLHREFYVAGGTLRPDAPSYVVRQADHLLLQGLLAGEFCYVLTARQMGKSSLMVRTAQALAGQGVQVVVLDLTAIGQNLTVEQWYAGLITHAAHQAGLEDAMDAFWDTHQRIGPCQRFFLGLEEMIRLRARTRPEGPMQPWVLFVDEIDTVRSLKFSTDEFFAAIRERRNRRSAGSTQPTVTFCLLGVAAPTDLILDTRTTPFNVGRRVELSDFTRGEAIPLAQGLERLDEPDPDARQRQAEVTLSRIIEWTGGHPYLTQRLCRAVAEHNAAAGDQPDTAPGPAQVDRLCDALFLSAPARERDDNLLFVRDRLLRSEADPAAVLDMYRKVRHGTRVPADDTHPVATILKLSGITRPGPHGLEVRNQIYRRVFNDAWIRQNLPGAELRRQREAFRRGVLRTATLAVMVLGLVGGLAAVAIHNARLSHDRLVRLYDSSGTRRVDQQDTLRALPYFVRALVELGDAGPAARAERLRIGILLATSPQVDLLWTHQGPVADLDLDAALGLVLSVGDDGAAQVWDLDRGRQVASFAQRNAFLEGLLLPDRKAVLRDSFRNLYLWDLRAGPAALVASNIHNAVFDPVRNAVLTGSTGGEIRWLQPPSGEVLGQVPPPPGRAGHAVTRLAVSPDGAWIAATLAYEQLWLLERVTGQWRQLHNSRAGAGYEVVAFSPDSRRLVVGGKDNKAWFWNEPPFARAPLEVRHDSWIHTAEFSPDGQYLLTASSDATARLTYADDGRPAASAMRHSHAVRLATFSPNGRWLVTCGYEGVARIRDAVSGEPLLPFLPHTGNVSDAIFGPSTNGFITAGSDGTVRVWQLTPGMKFLRLGDHPGGITNAVFSPSGDRVLASGHDGTASVSGVPSGRELFRVTNAACIETALFSSDGRWVVTASWDGTAAVWDAFDGRRLGPGFKEHRAPIVALALDSERGRVATGDQAGHIAVWEAHSGLRIAGMASTNEALVHHLAFSPDGTLLAAAIRANVTELWDPANGTCLAQLGLPPPGRDHPRQERPAVHLAFSRDGHRLVIAECDDSFDKAKATLWRVQGRTAVWQHDLPHNDGVKQAIFSPSGQLVATASEDGTMRLWRANDGQPLTPGLSHGYQVTGLAFSRDSRVLMTLSGSGSVQLWEATTGEPLMRPIFPPDGKACGAALDPSGKHVFLGTRNGATYLWSAPVATAPLEDLQTTAELLASHRLDRNAVSTGLSGPESHTRWLRYQARQP